MRMIIILLGIAVLSLTACENKDSNHETVPTMQINVLEHSESFSESAEVRTTEADRTNEAESSNEDDGFKDENGRHISWSIDALDGSHIVIDAMVDTSAVERLGKYEYVPVEFTDEMRQSLFESVLNENADKASYDERSDMWEAYMSSSPTDYWLFSYKSAFMSSDEKIVNFYYSVPDLYPFDDNRQARISDCGVNKPVDEVVNECEKVLIDILGEEIYKVDHISAYGNNGRTPYYKLVLRQKLDGMRVTSCHDINILYDDNGIEKFYGSLYAFREIGPNKDIISVDEAVEIVSDGIKLIHDGEPRDLLISKITLEYLAVKGNEICPVWRFNVGADDEEINYNSERIIAVNAVTGEFICEYRRMEP